MITLRRRDNKRREGKSRPWRPILIAAPVALLFSALIWTIDWPHVAQLAGDLRDAFLDHSYFSVREIKVIGGSRVGGSEIVALAGLSHGMNVWKINARAIEAKVKGHPWVRQVIVRREFPHRVVIEVEERVPKGIVALG
ncbi:MAG: cell division protein FtsQ/DivIB, partial [bacterium]